jgi:hypothetical protein
VGLKNSPLSAPVDLGGSVAHFLLFWLMRSERWAQRAVDEATEGIDFPTGADVA